MKLYKKYIFFNLIFFIFHLLIQYFFNKDIIFTYATLLIQFLIFCHFLCILYFEARRIRNNCLLLKQFINLYFFHLGHRKVTLYRFAVYMYNEKEPLTLQEISSANNLYEMSSFRINQAVNAMIVNEINLKYSLSDSGIAFTKILSFLRNLYF